MPAHSVVASNRRRKHAPELAEGCVLSLPKGPAPAVCDELGPDRESD